MSPSVEFAHIGLLLNLILNSVLGPFSLNWRIFQMPMVGLFINVCLQAITKKRSSPSTYLVLRLKLEILYSNRLPIVAWIYIGKVY